MAKTPWDDLAEPYEIRDEDTWDEIRDEDTWDDPTIPTATNQSQDVVLSGEIIYFPQSSNVIWLKWDDKSNPENPTLYMAFGKSGKRQGSIYGYLGVTTAEVLAIAYADSVGRAVTDILKGRGLGRFGSLKPYFYVAGNALWDTDADSITRHSAIPMAPGGAPFPDYHPLSNYAGAPGLMGVDNPNSPLWRSANQRGGFGRKTGRRT